MKSSKILVIKDLYFNLPDNFDGTVTDALELLLKYRKSQSINYVKEDDKKPSNNNLLNLLKDKNRKCYCDECIFDFNKLIKEIDK